MSKPIDITDRLMELEQEANALIETMKVLQQAWQLGYRFIDENDEPYMNGDNVHNITEAIKK